jgi:hypothetical protein
MSCSPQGTLERAAQLMWDDDLGAVSLDALGVTLARISEPRRLHAVAAE